MTAVAMAEVTAASYRLAAGGNQTETCNEVLIHHSSFIIHRWKLASP
jgi:hypothetical protein